MNSYVQTPPSKELFEETKSGSFTQDKINIERLINTSDNVINVCCLCNKVDENLSVTDCKHRICYSCINLLYKDQYE